MANSSSSRSLSDLFFRFGTRRADAALPTVSAPVPSDDGLHTTRALRKFLSCLTSRQSPVLLDLGPVVGSNVSFFGEQLGCKIFVEDVFADVDRHVRQGALAAFPGFLAQRFGQADGSFDGVLCWNLFDYLDRPAAQALARQLVRLLRPEGALLAFFGTLQPRDTRYVKYVIVDESTLRHRPYASAGGRQAVFLNGDIIKMFDGLRVSDSILLKTNVREILFRKPAPLAPVPAAPVR